MRTALLILAVTALYERAVRHDVREHRIPQRIPLALGALALLHPQALTEPACWAAIVAQTMLFILLYLIGYFAPADVRILAASALTLHAPSFPRFSATLLLVAALLIKELRGLLLHRRSGSPPGDEPFMPYLAAAWGLLLLALLLRSALA
jgi:Flp pilus assembly protein protease CpaA